jgi:hypothetical protein
MIIIETETNNKQTFFGRVKAQDSAPLIPDAAGLNFADYFQ